MLPRRDPLLERPNILWALAKAGRHESPIFERAAEALETRRFEGFNPQDFANILWAPKGCHVVEIIPIDVHLDFQCGLTPFWHVSELLLLTKHAFVAYAGRMFEPFELPVVEFIAFLRASRIV